MPRLASCDGVVARAFDLQKVSPVSLVMLFLPLQQPAHQYIY
jgi:hypothetical protein